MNQEAIDYLKIIFGPGAVIIGGLILRGIWKLIPILFDTIVEMRLLRAGLEEVKSYGLRLNNIEADVDVAHRKIRELTLAKEKQNES